MHHRTNAMLLGLAMASLIAIAVPAYADDLITVKVDGAIAPSVPQGSAVTIDNSFVSATGGSKNDITWIAVGTPGGSLYVFVPTNAFHVIEFDTSTSGGGITCNVPFGGPGTMSTSGQFGTGSVNIFTPCDKSNPLWKLASSLSPTELANDCTAGTPPATTGSLVDGDTSQTGLYGVFTCYDVLLSSGSFAACSAPSVIAPCGLQVFHSVPEFGSLSVVVGAAMIGLIFVRRRMVVPKV